MNGLADYILWLPSWYPNAEDPFDGDFIQRHAQAAATGNTIHVLFVKPIQQHLEQREVVHRNGRLKEQIIYIKKEHGLLKKLARQRVWFKIYAAAIRQLIEANGLPKLVHVHVPWRAGAIALWMKKKFSLPFIVTEHWGIYNSVVADRFSRRPLWMQLFIRRMFSRADICVSVSQALAKDIRRHGVLKKFVVIPNVVDTSLFRYGPHQNSRFTFLHVSNMVPLKNVAGILEAFQVLQQTGVDAQLILIGNRDDTYIKYADALQLNKDHIFFQGEIPHADVAQEMQPAHCLVLNSDMENAPCVISEALCCGVPVIATAVGGIPELADETNSILVPPRDTAALAAAMQRMYEDFKKFNRAEIAAAAAARFGVATIAGQFTALYHTIEENL